MLCTVKVEQLGLQNILEQLYLTTLLSGVSLKYFSPFYYTGTRGCVTVSVTPPVSLIHIYRMNNERLVCFDDKRCVSFL